MSPGVTTGQLTLDGLVSHPTPPSLTLGLHRDEVCTLYLVFKEPRTYFHSPADASSNLLDLAPALFGGTFQTYDDYHFPVNPFLRCVQDFFGHLFEAHCVSFEFANSQETFQAAATF